MKLRTLLIYSSPSHTISTLKLRVLRINKARIREGYGVKLLYNSELVYG